MLPSKTRSGERWKAASPSPRFYHDISEKNNVLPRVVSLWHIHHHSGALTRLLQVAVHEEVEFLGRERHFSSAKKKETSRKNKQMKSRRRLLMPGFPLCVCHFRCAHSQRRGSVERRNDQSTVVAAAGSP
jgi:hypothetical protein